VKDWTAETHQPSMHPGSQRPRPHMWLRSMPTAGNFSEKCHSLFWILVMMTPTVIKPSRCPAYGQYASACKILSSYDAEFRRR